MTPRLVNPFADSSGKEGRLMRSAPFTPRFLPAVLLAAGFGLAPSVGAQVDVQSIQDRALHLAQQAMDRATLMSDQAMRDAEDAIAGIDFDDMAVESFMSRELGGSREIVKNAPYTAQAVTETTQMLMDGNRIVHRSVALLARDSAGRTRQERRTEHGGTAYIYDPIDNRSYVLRLASKTAVSLPRVPASPAPPVPPAPPAAPVPPAAPAPPAPPKSGAVAVQPGRVVVRKGSQDGTEDVHVEVIRVGRDDEHDSADMQGHSLPMPPMPPLTMHGHPLGLPYGQADRPVTEALGSRDFDGVRADGKRTTRTIPAGAIGNEKPIAIVSERWFSPDLNIVVMSRNVDPRSGETVYRLTDLKRAEPSAELFKVPADYKVRGERAR
jgi:hypothetical protein